MLVPYLKVLVKQSVLTTTNRNVMPQELAMLMVMYGEPNVEVLGPVMKPNPVEGESPYVEVEVDPAYEYVRLGNQYGTDKQGRPWIERVFGEPHEGRLVKTIEGGMAKFFPPLDEPVELPPEESIEEPKTSAKKSRRAAA